MRDRGPVDYGLPGSLRVRIAEEPDEEPDDVDPALDKTEARLSVKRYAPSHTAPTEIELTCGCIFTVAEYLPCSKGHS